MLRPLFAIALVVVIGGACLLMVASKLTRYPRVGCLIQTGGADYGPQAPCASQLPTIGTLALPNAIAHDHTKAESSSVLLTTCPWHEPGP